MGKNEGGLVNHLNKLSTTGHEDPDGLFRDADEFYCERAGSVVPVGEGNSFMENNCFNCPLFAGSVQGAGIECLYVDSGAKGDALGLLAVDYTDPRVDARAIADERRKTREADINSPAMQKVLGGEVQGKNPKLIVSK